MKIALIGKMHDGKTTLAEHLTTFYGFKRHSLGDPIKDAAVEAINAVLFFLNAEDEMTRERLEQDKDVLRPMLTTVGDTIGREYVGPKEIWLDAFFKRTAQLPPTTFIVCDDCRRKLEADRLQADGFYLVRVARNEQERVESIRKQLSKRFAGDDLEDELERIINHPSEREVDEIVPHRLIVASSVEELHRKAGQMMRYLMFRNAE